MARIREYAEDNTITGGDKLLGTDVNGNGTNNFSVSELKEFIESGINLVLPVPPHYFPVVNTEANDVQVSGIRSDYERLAVDILFLPSQSSEVGEHVSVNEGAWSVLADGSQWYLQVEEYTAPYNLLSFIGKKVRGIFGVTNTELVMTIDSIAQREDPDSMAGDKYDYFIDDADAVNPKRIFRFNITRETPSDWGALTETEAFYTELEVRASDNDNVTLDIATVYFQSDVDMKSVHIDELDVDRIIFNKTSDPLVNEEGIRFGDLNSSIYTNLVLDPSTDNLKLETFGGAIFDIQSPTEIDDTLEVDGATRLNSSLLVEGNATFNSDTFVEGNSTIFNSNELDFKIKRNRLENFDNFENVIISKDGIQRRDYANTTFDITYVIANTPTDRRDSNNNVVTPHNSGELRSIQIGDTYWTIPQAVSQVAQILPGFGEGLTGPSDAIITGTFFYGTDEGTFAEWQSTPSGQVTGQSIPQGDTAIVISTDQRAAMNTLWNNLDLAAQSGQRLFFIESTDTLPSDISQGDRVQVNTYEVVSYVNDTGSMTFSLVGEGIIFVSAPNFQLQNIASDSNEETILVLDNNNHVRQKEFSDIAGIAATANYVDTLDSNSFGTLKELTFESGPHSHNVSTNGTGGNVNVDVTGRLPFDPHGDEGSEYVDDFDASAWHSYALGHIDSEKTVTLPASADLKTGAVVRIINLSDLDDNGNQVNTSALWSVTAGSGDRIMKLPADEATIVLNDANSHDFIWTGNNNIGWVIK